MGKGAGRRIPVNIPSGDEPVHIDTGMLVSVSHSDGNHTTTYVLCVSMCNYREYVNSSDEDVALGAFLRHQFPKLFWRSICTNSFVETESSPFQYTRSTVSNGVDPDELADYLIKDGYQPVINPYKTVIDPYQTLSKPTQILLKQESNVWVVQTQMAEGLVGVTMPRSLHFSQEDVQLPEPSR